MTRNRTRKSLESILARLDLNSLDDGQLVTVVREYLSNEGGGKIPPDRIPRKQVAEFITRLIKTGEDDKTEVYPTQIQRLDEGTGSLREWPRRDVFLDKFKVLLFGNAESDKDELTSDLELHLVNDAVVKPVWGLLRQGIDKLLNRSLSLTDRDGDHFGEVGFGSEVCKFLYKEGTPEACVRYDRFMSRLALRRHLGASDWPAPDHPSSVLTIARCPAGFMAIGVPWCPRVNMAREFSRVSDGGQTENTRRLIEKIKDFQIVFHIGEGYVKALDTTDEEIIEDKVMAAIKKCWNWEPDLTALKGQQFSSLNDLGPRLGLGVAEEEQETGASCDAGQGEKRSYEAVYRAAVAQFLTTRSLIASRNATGDNQLFRLFRLFPNEINEVRDTVDKEVKQLEYLGSAAPSHIDSFIGACFLIQRVVEKAARFALWSWLREYQNQSTAFKGAFRALDGEEPTGWWL